VTQICRDGTTTIYREAIPTTAIWHLMIIFDARRRRTNRGVSQKVQRANAIYSGPGTTPTMRIHVNVRYDVLDRESIDSLHLPVPQEDVETRKNPLDDRSHVGIRNRPLRGLLEGKVERDVMSTNAKSEGPNAERGEIKRKSGKVMR
jgi:hypothetical protein